MKLKKIKKYLFIYYYNLRGIQRQSISNFIRNNNASGKLNFDIAIISAKNSRRNGIFIGIDI